MLENDAMTKGSDPGPFSTMLRKLGVYLTNLLGVQHKPRMQEQKSETQAIPDSRILISATFLGKMLSVHVAPSS